MTPLALRMKNFGSFKQEQTFEFPREPGLYLMLGKNEVEPRLTGNATGKTTIWNALTWVVYAKTASGLKAGDVCSWDATKGVRVDFDFMPDDEVVWTCTRTWGPNSWTLSTEGEPAIDLAKDPENPLLAALRVHFDAWLCAVLMAQGEDYFLDMEKGQQAGLFGSVMNLEEWERRSMRATKAASEQEHIATGLEIELSHVRGQLDSLESTHILEDLENWERKQLERLHRLEDDHEVLCKRRKGLKEALDRAVVSTKEATDALASAKANNALEDEYDLVCANVRKHEDKLLVLEQQASALVSHTKQLSNSEGTCPVCGSKLDTRHWQDEMRRAERVALGIQSEAKNIEATLDIARSRRDVLEADIDAAEDLERAADRTAVEERRALLDLETCDKHLDDVEEMYEEVENEVNPFEAALQRMHDKAKDVEAEVNRLVRAVDDADSLHLIKAMWVRGFKEIRLREIAAALAELEVEVNSAVIALGLDDWQLEFHVDRETKSGTVQRGFSVSVRAPSAFDRPVPWEAWSGGEKQRLRIAGNAGLSDLVRTRTGCDLQLEVWDEPTNGLSPEGKTELFSYLVDRARNEQRVIFLLDHQAHDFAQFAGTCTVIKTPSGSRLRWTW